MIVSNIKNKGLRFNIHNSKNIPYIKMPIVANHSLYKESNSEGILSVLQDKYNQLVKVKQKIIVKLKDNKEKKRQEKVIKNINSLNNQYLLLLQQENIDSEELLNKINQSYSNLKINIVPMTFSGLTREEMLEVYKNSIQYYSKNGEQALIEKTRELTRSEEQREIVLDEIFKLLHKDIEYYVSSEIAKKLTTTLHPISPNKNLESSEELSGEIKNIYKIFQVNSEKVNNLLLSFRALSKNYFTVTADNIEEVLNLKKGNLCALLERVPLAGLLPKAFRVKEQCKAIDILLENYKNITDAYVQNGTQKVMLEYFNQYQIVIDYLKSVLPKFEKAGNIQLLNTITEDITDSYEKKVEVYKNLLNIYSNKGLKIEKAGAKIKKNAKIELAFKYVSTLLVLN